jgi:hypothetical protein
MKQTDLFDTATVDPLEIPSFLRRKAGEIRVPVGGQSIVKPLLDPAESKPVKRRHAFRGGQRDLAAREVAAIVARSTVEGRRGPAATRDQIVAQAPWKSDRAVEAAIRAAISQGFIESRDGVYRRTGKP